MAGDPEARDLATDVLPAPDPGVVVPRDKPRADAAASLIGRSLGKFHLVEQLGRGGSGDVYRAEQVQLGRSAVIKVLRREIANVPNRVERFLREAKLASKLDHPYASHVYAFGAEPDGVLWIAMEYIQGATLDELVARRGPMPAAIFGPLFARLCEVVHTAHELGIVHRDIKGSNVMVIERAGQLLPKLLDFGIAKAFDAVDFSGEGLPAADDGGLTGHGATLGSPHYMAPEQWVSPATVDARADIYALGVLAYRCVSGRLPYQTIPRMDLAHAHLSLPPPPLPPSVPSPIAEVIGRALAKQPEARWASALGLGEALRGAASVDGRVPEAVPIFDPAIRDAWVRGGPQPIADAVARLARATTTVEADAALRELVAITCRWLAVLGLSQLAPEKLASTRTPDPELRRTPDPEARRTPLPEGELAPVRDAAYAEVRERVRGVVGRDDAAPWVRLARAAVIAEPTLPALEAALAGSAALESLADRLDDRDRARTATGLAFDITAAADALRPLESLLAYQLVVGLGGAAESWQGTRRRDRERVVVWGEPLPDGVVALLDGTGRVVARLSPLVQVISPLPSAEPELFILWRSARGHARLVAAPWGFERDDDAAAARLASLTTEQTDTYADADIERSPYPGLAPYSVGDADRFVGREREIEALANRLVRAPLLAVLGPSGAGKSSFIHAGVLPRLAEHHEIITMRPGRHPLHALAALPPLGIDPATFATEPSIPASEPADERVQERGARLEEAKCGVDDLVTKLRTLGERAPRGLVVVVDQLEELVTLCADEQERRQFAEVLARSADAPTAPVRVIVTLRDDFATVIESQSALRGRFEVFVLATPLPEALRRIVVEPARRSRVAIDPQVVDDMVAEVAGRPASLPLLSFTASRLWDKRDRELRKISHDAYLEIGGVAGALSTYADGVYASLAKRDQNVVRDLFSRLVATDGTRIPAPRAELEQIPSAAGVLGHLIDARLLVVREDDGIDVVEIVHECLAERWPRLARWRSEDAADRALLADVRTAARRWIEGGRRTDLLWRGAALLELRALAARSTAMTGREREFTDASEHAAQRSRRIRRVIVAAVMVVLAGVAVVMAYLGIAANKSRGAAETSATQAQLAARLAEDRLTASLVAQGKRELNDNHALAALAYFGEAMRRGADSPALRLMLSYASRGWRFERPVEDWDVNALHVGTTHVITGDITGTLSWRDPRGKLVDSMKLPHGYIYDVRGESERKLLVACRDAIAVVDIEGKQILHAFKPKTMPYDFAWGVGDDEVTVFENTAIRVYGLDGTVRRELQMLMQGSSPPFVSPSRKHAFYEEDGNLSSLDLVTMKPKTLLKDGWSGIAGAGSPYVAMLDRARTIHVFAAKDGAPVRQIRASNQPIELVISEAGDRIAAVSEHDIVIYDLAGEIVSVVPAFSRRDQVWIEGDEAWTTSADGVLRRFIKTDLVASVPRHSSDIYMLDRIGDAILTRGADGLVAFTDANARHFVHEPRPCQHTSFGPEGVTVAYLCDGKQLVYVGKRRVAEIQDDGGYGPIAYEPVAKRTAMAGTAIQIFDEHGKRIATAPSHEKLGAIAFESADQLLVGDPPRGTGIWRWAFIADRWEQVAPFDEPAALASAPGGILVGRRKSVVTLQGGRETGLRETSALVMSMTTSADRRWVAVQLENGETLIFDGTTLQLQRSLPPSDGQGSSAIFDAKGDFLLRMHRDVLTIWERSSGEDVVKSFDLFRNAIGGAFLDDGRLELTGRAIGLLDIPRDTRPVAEILRDIDCRVRLRVKAGRLEPVKPTCGP